MAKPDRLNKQGEPVEAVGAWVPRIWKTYSEVVQQRRALKGGHAAVVELALRELFEREGLIPLPIASDAARAAA